MCEWITFFENLITVRVSVGRYHRLCATVSTVKKYRGTRYYRDGTFAITSTGRPAGITGDLSVKYRGSTVVPWYRPTLVRVPSNLSHGQLITAQNRMTS